MRRFQRKITYLLALIFLLIVLPEHAEAKETANMSGRKIAIVFDNSDSMIREGSREKSDTSKYISRWSEATYALETLMCMLPDTDEVSLYTVDKDNYGGESGKRITKDNIDIIIQGIGISALTCTDGMEKAYDWVGKGTSQERWVVLITDGEFTDHNGNILSALDSIGTHLENKQAQDIQTICIGLDLSEKQKEDIERLEERYRDCFTFYPTIADGGETGIQDTILKISEKIYNMEKLDNDLIQSENGEIITNESGMTWKSQIVFSDYLQEVVVLAQIKDNVTEKESDNISVVHSPSSLIWGGVEKHNNSLKPNSNFFIDETCVNEMLKTEPMYTCFIWHYTASELEKKELTFTVEGEVSLDDFTYQIYYVISDAAIFTPTVTGVSQTSDTILNTDGSQVVVEGEIQLDYTISNGAVEISKDLLAIKTLRNVELCWDGNAVDAQSIQTVMYSAEKMHTLTVTYNGNSYVLNVAVDPDLTQMERYTIRFLDQRDISMDDESEWILRAQVSEELRPWLKKNLDLLSVTVRDYNGSELEYGKVEMKDDGEIVIHEVTFDQVALEQTDSNGQCTAEIAISKEQKIICDSYSFRLTQGEPELVLTQTTGFSLWMRRGKTDISISVCFSGKETEVIWNQDETVLYSTDNGDAKAEDLYFTVTDELDDSGRAVLHYEAKNWFRFLLPSGFIFPTNDQSEINLKGNNSVGIGLDGTVVYSRSNYTYKIAIENGKISSAVRYAKGSENGEVCAATITENFSYQWHNYLWIYTIILVLLVIVLIAIVIWYVMNCNYLNNGRSLSREKYEIKKKIPVEDALLYWTCENVPRLEKVDQAITTRADGGPDAKGCEIKGKMMTLYLNTYEYEKEVFEKNEKIYLTGTKQGYEIKIDKETKAAMDKKGGWCRPLDEPLKLKNVGETFDLIFPPVEGQSGEMKFSLVYQHERNCEGEKKRLLGWFVLWLVIIVLLFIALVCIFDNVWAYFSCLK